MAVVRYATTYTSYTEVGALTVELGVAGATELEHRKAKEEPRSTAHPRHAPAVRSVCPARPVVDMYARAWFWRWLN